MRYLSEQEMDIATRFLFLSMAVTVMEQDIRFVENGRFKIKEPYIEVLEMLIARAKAERKSLRKTMQDRKIRISTLNKNDSFTSYLFIAGRKEEQRNYFNPAIRKHVENIIRELIARGIQTAEINSANH